MAANYAATLKTTRMQAVADAISGGSLVIGTSALSGSIGILATVSLNTPAATVSGPTLTISGVPLSVIASAAGTAALAELRNHAGTTITSGLTVGTSNADVIVTTTAILLGGTVTVSAGTIVHG